MIRWLALFFLLGFSALLTSCASEKETDSGVTSMPWNRPESWEGKGPLGGFTQQGR